MVAITLKHMFCFYLSQLQMVELKLKEYMERLRSIYFHALCAFYLRENIQEATATDIVPDQAEENHKVISEFNNFF